MDDLYSVELVEGLVIGEMQGTRAVYKRVYLRESCEQFLHDAIRQVQQLMRGADGRMHLVHNEALYEAARIARHIDRITGNGPELRQPDIDLALLGKMHPLDVARIAEQLLHIELAAQVRWGLITQDEYDLILLGKVIGKKPLTPQESLQALKKIIDSISRSTHTSIDALCQMPLAELEATLQNLVETAN